MYVCYFLTVGIIASLWWHDILYGLSVLFQKMQLLLSETHWPLPSSMVGPREYWMIYRGPGFLTLFLAHPLSPLSRQQVASLSVFTYAACKLKGQCHENFASGFFHESPSPKPLKMTLESFQIFPKIRKDICRSRCTTGINDTGSKFATGVNDNSGKFCYRCNWLCW